MRLDRPLCLAASLAALLGLSACAGGPPPGEGLDGPDSPGAREDRMLFISPAGEPFHGSPGQPYPVAAWFARADADHDGKLTRAEFRADAEAFFRRLDTDHNGVVDGFEMAAYEQAIAPEIQPYVGRLRAGEGMNMNLGRRNGGRGGPGDDGGGGERPKSRNAGPSLQGAAPYALLNEPEPVAAADADLSGSVSLAEAMAAADRRFTLLDTMGQGSLTLATLPKTPIQALMERQQARDRGRKGRPPQQRERRREP